MKTPEMNIHGKKIDAKIGKKKNKRRDVSSHKLRYELHANITN